MLFDIYLWMAFAHFLLAAYLAPKEDSFFPSLFSCMVVGFTWPLIWALALWMVITGKDIDGL